MANRPAPLEKLDDAFTLATVVHEYVAELARELAVLDASDARVRELLHESARIVTSSMPDLTTRLREFERRWVDESVLDPAAAERTENAMDAEFLRIGEKLERLVRRQDDVARELRRLAERARGRKR